MNSWMYEKITTIIVYGTYYYTKGVYIYIRFSFRYIKTSSYFMCNHIYSTYLHYFHLFLYIHIYIYIYLGDIFNFHNTNTHNKYNWQQIYWNQGKLYGPAYETRFHTSPIWSLSLFSISFISAWMLGKALQTINCLFQWDIFFHNGKNCKLSGGVFGHIHTRHTCY